MERFEASSAAVAAPYRVAGEPIADELPFSRSELLGALIRPARMIQLILAEHVRLARTIAESIGPARLLALLVVAAIVLPLPFGSVLGVHTAWRVSALFAGTAVICFPSLHVFCSYLGCRLTLTQTLSIALIAPAVAGTFALGFAPVLAFIATTTKDGGLTLSLLAPGLIAVAMLAGVAHMWRCILVDGTLRSGPFGKVVLPWQCLFAYVAYRMGFALELW